MLIFDIETRADDTLTTREQYDALGRRPSSTYKKDESIAKWKDEDYADWVAKAALNPFTAQVCAVGTYLVHDTARPELDELHIWMANQWAECELLDFFATETRRTAGPLVTYNGATFDLPFLAARYTRDGTTIPFDMSEVTNKYRHGRHLDLMTAVTAGGRAGWSASLLAAARGLGADASAMYGSGKDVAGWVADHRWDEVERHLRGDLLTTASLLRRMRKAGWV